MWERGKGNHRDNKQLREREKGTLERINICDKGRGTLERRSSCGSGEWEPWRGIADVEAGKGNPGENKQLWSGEREPWNNNQLLKGGSKPW